MTNIVTFRPAPRVDRTQNAAQLLAGLAQGRRTADDVFWLKENAEALNAINASGVALPPEALGVYAEFYDGIEEKVRFYPQYYRFFLSLCLDLEDLGMSGNKGRGLCRWAAAAGLADAELSDLQRAEARLLLARRNAADAPGEGALGDRLRQFMRRGDTFALPNRKAAYELTHIVFYLTDFGRNQIALGEEEVTSLEYTGVIAFLDQNYDLLAEVCLALSYIGQTPSPIWTQAVATAHGHIVPCIGEGAVTAKDAYHTYLVTGWMQATLSNSGFEADVPAGKLHFAAHGQAPSALRPLSECLADLGVLRSGDWDGMRGRVIPYLGAQSRNILQQAEASTDKFDRFFRGFARASGTFETRTG
ncbi:hypothetical protein Z946_3721 [Sulfitobacter noctilucicola]|uniref:Uncharacterized protein n=1 Tax=Sulfitobacter noctilucicola TaxID=1342301 RepID=A0A7W6M7S1_9RHOB|nr:hypothetical protein [Sulfitobacter noctilucicola]KIN64828.1 hypothetical protein Z946_3721 [Sulfitobacter noctilucicola]MBB4174028.1 hypothetical protein [Sulfitobacter noctilucicola]